MKLRNKKTGKIENFALVVANGDVDDMTIAELNKEWEDYDDESDFWFIDNLLELSHCQRNIPHHIIERFKGVNNYYKTEEEAEKAVEKLRIWIRGEDA